MIITCPHCQTRYQVTYEAIGSAGRKVQCATCNQAWQQDPVAAEEDHRDHLQAQVDEDKLDEAFSTAEKDAAAERERERERRLEAIALAGSLNEPTKVDPALQRKRQRAFKRRQSTLFAKLPLARLRRAARIGGTVLLIGLLVGGYFGRTAIVSAFPAMAGVYASIGLGVNVVGLEFTDVSTLRTLIDGKEVLMVSANIKGLATQAVPVPPVVVTLIGNANTPIYQWSVKLDANDLMAGEVTALQTQLTLPPGNIDRVRLSFAGGHGDPLLPPPAPPTGGTMPDPAAPPAPAGDAPASSTTTAEPH